MEQAQVVDTKDVMAPMGKPSTGDLFIFRPLAAPPPAQPSPKPAGSPFFLRFRPAPFPAQVVRSKPQDPLLEPDAAHFRRLLAQYRAFPADGADPAACLHFDLQAISIIYGLVAKSERGVLTYADLHQLEVAVLRVMPEAVLRGEARERRTRARASAAPIPLHEHLRSKIMPTKAVPKDDAEGPIEALRTEMATLLSETPHQRAEVSPRAEARAAAWQVSACWAFGLIVMGILGIVLIHLSPVPRSVEPAIPLLMALTGGAAAAITYIRREHP